MSSVFSKKYELKVLLILLVLSVMACLFVPLVGIKIISLSDLISGNVSEMESAILYKIRIPRVLFAFFVGASLSLCGVLFQALFRNQLASPFTMGVSSAAALGAACYFKLSGAFTLLGFSGASVFAFAFALLSVLLLMSLSKRSFSSSGGGILLLGVALSFFCSSLVVFLQYLSDLAEVFSITRWLMGSLDIIGLKPVFLLFPFSLLIAGIALYFAPALDIISISEELALSRGVDVKRVSRILFVAASFLVALSVSLCGVIGFVGIMVPHICRLILGSRHRPLVPGAFLLGGLFLVFCDAFSRTIIPPSEIPVGVITSLLGGPFFFFLLVTRSRNKISE